MSTLETVWIEADDPRMEQAHALRHEALFAPFGIPRDDRWDDGGVDRRHVVALRDGQVAGYACMLVAADGSAHVRQVSVWPHLQRGGVGRALMESIEAEARGTGLTLLWLNARVPAEDFYRRLGYRTVSGEFPSGRTGIPHVRMEKMLDR